MGPARERFDEGRDLITYLSSSCSATMMPMSYRGSGIPRPDGANGATGHDNRTASGKDGLTATGRTIVVGLAAGNQGNMAAIDL